MSSFWLILKQQWTIKISSPLFSIFSLAAILVGSRDHRTHFGRGPSKDHSTKVWFKLAQWSWLKCEKLTDGRSVVTIAHMTLWVRWANKGEQLVPFKFVGCFLLYIAKKNNMCASYFILNCTDETQVFEMAICRTKIYCNFGTFITTGSMSLSGGLLIPEGIHQPSSPVIRYWPEKTILFWKLKILARNHI